MPRKTTRAILIFHGRASTGTAPIHFDIDWTFFLEHVFIRRKSLYPAGLGR